MPKYLVSWTEELWYEHEIEADSEKQAKEMVFDASFEWPDPHHFEVQESVIVEEVNA